MKTLKSVATHTKFNTLRVNVSAETVKKPLPPKRKPQKIDPKQMLLNTKLQRELEKKGSVSFSPENGNLEIDAGYLRLPADITLLPTHEVGKHLNAFTQQKMYMRTLHLQMQCLTEDCRRGYDQARYAIASEFSGSKTVTEKDFMVNNDPRVLPSHERWLEAKMKVSMVKDTVDSITDAIFLISREISRRESDFNHERREHNVGYSV